MDVPRIHGVHRLNTLVKEKVQYIIPVNDDELDTIDDIYIDTRYPGNFGLLPSGFPSKEQAEEFIELTDRIYNSTLIFLKKSRKI